MSNFGDKLQARHSFYTTSKVSKESTQSLWKSDINLIPTNNRKGCGEYYKRYEHDELPVKDSSINSNNFSTEGTGDRSLTNSRLDKLETKVFQNISQVLQNDASSYSSLESNIKFFKTTVEQIFDAFNASMQDFKLYKRKFNEILEKYNTSNSIGDMEEFIKDVIQHIRSSKSVSNESRKSTDGSKTFEINCRDTNSTECGTTGTESDRLLENLHSVVEAYKNDNYMTDSTLDDKSSKIKRYPRKEKINIYLLSTPPCIQIDTNDRNLMSEVNLQDPKSSVESKVASADNLKKLATKRRELEDYVMQQQSSEFPERDIPIRISSAKKNIFLNEDFVCDRERHDAKSFMSKICNFLCRKFRKNSFG